MRFGDIGLMVQPITPKHSPVPENKRTLSVACFSFFLESFLPEPFLPFYLYSSVFPLYHHQVNNSFTLFKVFMSFVQKSTGFNPRQGVAINQQKLKRGALQRKYNGGLSVKLSP